MSWIIIEMDGTRRVVDTHAATRRAVRAVATRQRRRGVVVLAGYLHQRGPVALARKVYP